jgi:uridine phosphorylase
MPHSVEPGEIPLEQASIVQAQAFVAFKCRKANRPFPALPKRCILGFFPQLYPYIKKTYSPEIINFLNRGHPYYCFRRKDIHLSFLFPGIGAPLSAVLLEETIAMGAETFLFIGTAGVLKEHIGRHELILPVGAVRDEGTSYHYQSAETAAVPDPDLLINIRKMLGMQQIPYHEGKTWTTDAPYRETAERVRQVIREGCIAVDMEAAALFCVARTRNVRIAGFFSSRDGVFENRWEPELPLNEEGRSVRQLFELAADALTFDMQESITKTNQRGS